MTPAWSSRAWRLSASCCEYLARIEDALRIERLLELPHDLDGSRPVLAQQGVALAQADPMFTRAGSANRERVIDHGIVDDRRLLPRGLVVGMENEEDVEIRSEEHTSELQSLIRISYAVFCLKKKK